ncbi:hypothetical protein H0H81_008666, partial [Sphagnurus paluster]
VLYRLTELEARIDTLEQNPVTEAAFVKKSELTDITDQLKKTSAGQVKSLAKLGEENQRLRQELEELKDKMKSDDETNSDSDSDDIAGQLSVQEKEAIEASQAAYC